MRLHDRLDGTIKRASRRYFATFYFCAENGLKKKIDAIKREAGVAEPLVLSGSASARSVEFVVSRKTHEDALRVAGFGKGGGSVFELLRKSTVTEQIDDEERVYAFDSTSPYNENSPDSGTVRWFCHWRKQKN